MKRRNILAVAILATMTLLAGCGDNNGGVSNNGVAGSLGVAGQEWRYLAEYTPLLSETEDVYLCSSVLTKGKVYCGLEKYDFTQENYLDQTSYYLSSTDITSGESTEFEIEVPFGDDRYGSVRKVVLFPDGTIGALWETYSTEYIDGLVYDSDYDEEIYYDEEIAEEDIEENEEAFDEESDEAIDVDVDYFEAMPISEAGYPAMYMDYEAETPIYYLIKYSDDGQMISSLQLADDMFTYDDEQSNDVEEDEFYYFLYPSDVLVDEDSNIYIYDGDTHIVCMDPDTGEKKDAFSIGEGYINSMEYYNGDLYICGYFGEEWKMGILVYDVATKQIENEITDIDGWISTLALGEDGNIYFSDGSDFYMIDKDTSETIKVFNWIDSDIDGNTIREISVSDDGSVYVIIEEWLNEYYNVSAAKLTYTEITEENRKEQIVLGTAYLDSDYTAAILQFNRNNPDYRISVVQYYNEIDFNDYDGEDAYTAYLMDQFTGDNPPDILDVSGVNARNLANQGYIIDLQEYFETNLNSEDYYENVLNAGRIGDSLYVISPYFVINSLIIPSEQEKNFTTEELCEYLMERLNDGAECEGYSRSDIMYTILSSGANAFVDWENGECHFDSDSFKEMLEICSNFPAEINYDDYYYDYIEQIDKMNNGDILFQYLWAGSIDEYISYSYELKNAQFVGLPMGDECAPEIQASGMMLAVSSASDCPDGAWAFIEYLLSDEVQRMCGWYSYPINRNIMEEILEDAGTVEYYTDENGNSVEVSKYGYMLGEEYIDISAAPEEILDMLRESAETGKGNFFYDDELYAIIEEESAAYFEGQKTLDEVVEVIQSRATMYVNENM